MSTDDTEALGGRVESWEGHEEAHHEALVRLLRLTKATFLARLSAACQHWRRNAISTDSDDLDLGMPKAWAEVRKPNLDNLFALWKRRASGTNAEMDDTAISHYYTRRVLHALYGFRVEQAKGDRIELPVLRLQVEVARFRKMVDDKKESFLDADRTVMRIVSYTRIQTVRIQAFLLNWLRGSAASRRLEWEARLAETEDAQTKMRTDHQEALVAEQACTQAAVTAREVTSSPCQPCFPHSCCWLSCNQRACVCVSSAESRD